MMGLSRRKVCALLGGLPGVASGMAGGFGGLGCGKEPRHLTVYNWGDYLAPEVLERFAAREGGASVTQDFFLSEGELFAKLQARAAYDLCVPLDYQLSRLQQHGLVRALDMKQLPGVANLAEKFPPWKARADRGGAVHAIPYLWGTTGIGYDSDKIATPPTSWKALFELRHAGRISVIDSKGDVFDQALLASGMGINSTDKEALQTKIFPMLKEQKKILRAYDSNPARALVSGETWIAQIDSGDLMRARASKPSLRYVIPEEGAAYWVDYLAVPVATAQVTLAHAFIEFLLDPEIAGLNANFLHFATPNRVALERGLIADKDDPQVYPPETLMPKLHVSEHWFGETENLVDKLWLELRGS
jgi:spermidine/putrescine transport system substrate-binding protein